MEGFVHPRYEDGSLSNLLPSIAARLDGKQGVLDLPTARKYVILMVDGLGWHALSDHAGHTEWMAARLSMTQQLTCGVPSTTAASLTSLGTGVPPGEHGIVGYTFLDPHADQVLNALTWEGGPKDVTPFQLVPTWYSRLGQRGHPGAAVSLARFESSSLQRIAFGGTTLFGIEYESVIEHVTDLVVESLVSHDVIYCYERRLDHLGHAHGVGSWQWLDQLAHVDDLVQELIGHLPAGVCLLVTGDHGMINVPEDRKLVIEQVPGLGGSRHIGGEGRLRQLYTDRPADLAAQWRDVLGDRAMVVLREEAVERGWFGPTVERAVLPRIGDVIVAMKQDWALMTETFPKEYTLVGMHGSLTPGEMLVPLFVHRG